MRYADVVIVGAGLLGCFSARALSAFDLKTVVLEQREDVCTGISRANTGIVYTGADTAPGTLKTELCVKANAEFDRLCRELDVPFSRCGSLMVAFGPRGLASLERKYKRGLQNGVKGLALLDPAETLRLEPHLANHVTGSLRAPGTGTVNPWELGIAACENAVQNGVEFHFRSEVLHISRRPNGFCVETAQDRYQCRAVINCAGLSADAVREFTQTPSVRIVPTAGDYLVLDRDFSGFLRHVIFHEPEQKEKGLTLVPTVDGNILVGPTERTECGVPYATAYGGLEQLRALCAAVMPQLPLDRVIRSFGAIRPNPYWVRQEDGQWKTEEKSISSFTVLDEEGLFSLIGIKTPGLTCAAQLGRYTAERVAAYLGSPGPNPRFEPARSAIKRVRGLDAAERSLLLRRDPDYGIIVCRCNEVSLAEVKQAVARGAVTVDGIKRRTGAGMGRCQGSYCLQGVLEALASPHGHDLSQIKKDGPETELIYGTI